MRMLQFIDQQRALMAQRPVPGLIVLFARGGNK